MIETVQSLAVLGAVTAAMIFYGRWCLRLLSPGDASDTGLSMAAGLAAFSALTAVFEISCTASASSLVAIVGAGAALQGVHLARHRNGLSIGMQAFFRSPGHWLAAALLAAFLINAARWHYGIIDDRMGYLVFPRRILQEGCIGRDAFNFRRIEVGLGGGGAYFYALFQSLVSASQTRLADLGLGSICLLFLVHGHAKALRLSVRAHALALLAAILVVIFSPIINNTPETLGKAELYALMRVAAGGIEPSPQARRGALVGLLFCSLLLLKTSYLVPASAVVAALYVPMLLTQPVGLTLLECGSAAGLAMALMLPWMLVSFSIAHTFWYPLLGDGTLRGQEAHGYASLPHFLSDSGRLGLIMAPACLMSALAVRQKRWPSQSPLALMPAFALLLTLLAQTKFTIFGYRYGALGAATVFLFYIPQALAAPAINRGAAFAGTALQALAILVLISNNTLGERWFYAGGLAGWVRGQPSGTDLPVMPGGKIPDYQAAIPAHVKMLALVPWPSRLDFARNDISVMDWPGMIGPPGMPALNDAAGWRAYLLGTGVRYVAYAYGGEVNFTDRSIASNIAFFSRPQTRSQYQIDLLTRFRDVKHLFNAMLGCGRPVFDDRATAVFDLTTLSPGCLRQPQAATAK